MRQWLTLQELEQKGRKAIHRIDGLSQRTAQLADGKKRPEHIRQRINQIQQWSVHTLLPRLSRVVVSLVGKCIVSRPGMPGMAQACTPGADPT